MNFCVNCRFCNKTNSNSKIVVYQHMCARTEKTYQHYVTNETIVIPPISCVSARRNDSICGPEGRFFEAKQ